MLTGGGCADAFLYVIIFILSVGGYLSSAQQRNSEGDERYDDQPTACMFS